MNIKRTSKPEKTNRNASLPSAARDLADRFNEALQSNDLATAYVVAEELLNHWPDSTASWTAAGLIALQLGQLEEASFRFATALNLAPRDYDANYNMALLEINRGYLDSALKRLTRLHRTHPESADLLNDIGVVYRFKDRPDRALASYSRALKMNPNNSSALENTITLCLNSGWQNRAIEFLNRLEAHPDLTDISRSDIEHWRVIIETPGGLDAILTYPVQTGTPG